MAEDTISGEPGPPVSGADIRTFLFADMRGYTRYTQEHGDEAASALAGRFADVVKATVPGFEGELLELRGDEALCVFRSARQALRASVELQRRLRTATDEEAAFPIGVGMGLDAGEAVPTHGGYRGASLNLAARLCALAKPGEILASETVIGLASRVDGLRFLEGRSAALKGMARPVRYVVVEPVQPLPPVPVASPPRRRRSRWLVAAGVVMAVVIAIALVVMAMSASSGTKKLSLGANVLAAMDPSSFTVRHQVSIGPAAALLSSAGSVWATLLSTGQVVRVTDSGAGPVSTPAGSSPSAIASACGQIWVAATGDGAVRQISPTGNPVVRPPIPVGNGPAVLATTARPARLWIGNALDQTVVAVDPCRGGRVGAPIQLAAAPVGMSVAGGSLWIAETSGSVEQINVASGQLIPPSVPLSAAPTAITASDGKLWVATADGNVSEIVPGRGVAWTRRVGGAPSSLAMVDGRLWVGHATSNDVTILTTSGKPTTNLLVGAPVGAITTSGGMVWLATLASQSSHVGGTLRIAVNPFEFASDSPDPPYGADTFAGAISRLTSDGLLGYLAVPGAASYQLVPDLAAAMPSVSADGRTYTVRLRSGIRFSNGHKLQPEDVAASYERVYRSIAGYAPTDIRGAANCQATHPKPPKPSKPPKHCDLSQGIVANDAANTVTFHLTKPYPRFEADVLAAPWIVPAGTPVDKTGYEKVPGTGPYRVLSRRVVRKSKTLGTQGQITLARNPYFHPWSQAQPPGYPNRILVTSHSLSPTAASSNVSLVERGNADYTPDSPPAGQLAQVSQLQGARVHVSFTLETDFGFMNTKAYPFNNLLVRRAINYALNRPKLLRQFQPTGVASCQLLPPEFPAYIPYCPYSTSVGRVTWSPALLAKARALVRKSGTIGAPITVVGALPGPDSGANVFADVLRRLGYHVHVRLLGVDNNAYLNTLTNPGRRPVIGNSFGWGADYLGAGDFMQLFQCHSPSPYGNALYCDHHFDQLVAQARALEGSNQVAANRVWTRADHYLTDQAAFIPLWNERPIVIVSQRVGNYQYDLRSGLPFLDQVWVK